MKAENTNAQAELEERLRFETLIADLSSKFVNLPADGVDAEIMEAQRRLCQFLSLDFSTLWQWSDESPGFFKLTHFYTALTGPQPPDRMTQDQYPWAAQQLLAGRIITVATVDELPVEAARDRETLLEFGIKSNLALPLAVGGGAPVGILGLGTTQAERDWPDALVNRLRLIAQIFANALSRKRAEEVLRASEARLKAGTDLAGLGYYEVDYGRQSCFVDARFREISGIPSEVQLGLEPVRFWQEHVHPDDRQFLLGERKKLHEGRIDQISAEYRYLHPAQGQRWLHHSARFAGRGAGGAGIRTFGVVRDITAQKQAEQEAVELRNNLAHLSRVTMLGELSGSMAHELNQPLTAILSNAQAAQRFIASGQANLDEVREILADIVAEDRRAGEIIRRLRRLLKKGEVQRGPLSVNDVVGEVLQFVRSDLVNQNFTAQTDLAPDLPLVHGDRVQLQQVLLNLVMNACEAMTGGHADARQLTIRTGQAEEGSVRVSVADHGPGIPADKLEQIFESFYTTKPQGMGLGLTVCRTIITGHGGKLWATNNPGRGATFHFTLPASQASERSGAVTGATKKGTTDDR